VERLRGDDDVRRAVRDAEPVECAVGGAYAGRGYLLVELVAHARARLDGDERLNVVAELRGGK
jgi:hypothetical protein